MRFMEALQGRLHPNTTNGETRPAMVIEKVTEHTREMVRPTPFIPGTCFPERETRDGTFLRVKEPDGRIVVIPVSKEVWQANGVNRPLVKAI